jgi:predicted DNA-binding ribbon-helix-helix protein
MIGSHKTSVSLEEAFWDGLKEISRERGKTLSERGVAIPGPGDYVRVWIS